METFIVMNEHGEFGVETNPSGFGGNGTTKLSFQSDINRATVFIELRYRNLCKNSKKQVVIKIPAVEERKVRLVGRE